MSTNSQPTQALNHFKENFESTYLEDLKKLVRIPSVSFPGFPEEEVTKSAHAVADLLRKRGLENVRILSLDGAHPYVVGERLRAPGKPTLLLYAHHDVQPPGRIERWETPPFEPTLKDGPGGLRMFARGSADDKTGIVVHTSAIDAYLKTIGELPVNVKVIIEGEEEIGSGHLEEFLSKYRDELKADILVLTDTTNFDCGVPGLTIALRGMVGVDIELKSLSKTVHSGMWGGPVPDPAMALSKVLSKLVDENGQIAIPGVMEQVRPLSADEKKYLNQVPYNEADFRRQAGVLPKVSLLKDEVSPVVQVWRKPSLTVNALQSSSRAQAGNTINDSAWARVTIRLVADMDPQRVQNQLEDFLKSLVPWGLELNLTPHGLTPPWSTEPKGPVFEAAEKALTLGYGKAPQMMGCGGSIPFVKPFAEALGGAPALLIGVEDPYTNAHGENESVLIQDLRSACLSQIYLFSEISKIKS
ncbi:MAG: M20/M25/M40 family metallo-hydrolase [Bdellovibrio sp.]|nr:M20/M25/M40 family metallo-hydrolase [Bdellovibrio sp.]